MITYLKPEINSLKSQSPKTSSARICYTRCCLFILKLKQIVINSQIKGHLSERDEVLQNLIQTLDLPEIKSTQNVFHDLMSCVIEQQIHYRSTKKIFQKMLATASIDTLTTENFEHFEERAFQSIKLSAQKYETVLRLVDFFEKDASDWMHLGDQDVRNLLSPIKGISHWTVDMILLYTLGRENVFPSDDYHLKQIMSKLYSLDLSSKSKSKMKAVAMPWEPYKSWAVRYLLAWKTFQQK